VEKQFFIQHVKGKSDEKTSDWVNVKGGGESLCWRYVLLVDWLQAVTLMIPHLVLKLGLCLALMAGGLPILNNPLCR